MHHSFHEFLHLQSLIFYLFFMRKKGSNEVASNFDLYSSVKSLGREELENEIHFSDLCLWWPNSRREAAGWGFLKYPQYKNSLEVFI